jgi:hypothetical protein
VARLTNIPVPRETSVVAKTFWKMSFNEERAKSLEKFNLRLIRLWQSAADAVQKSANRILGVL